MSLIESDLVLLQGPLRAQGSIMFNIKFQAFVLWALRFLQILKMFYVIKNCRLCNQEHYLEIILLFYAHFLQICDAASKKLFYTVFSVTCCLLT